MPLNFLQAALPSLRDEFLNFLRLCYGLYPLQLLHIFTVFVNLESVHDSQASSQLAVLRQTFGCFFYAPLAVLLQRGLAINELAPFAEHFCILLRLAGLYRQGNMLPSWLLSLSLIPQLSILFLCLHRHVHQVWTCASHARCAGLSID